MKKWVLLALMAAYAPACLGAAPGKAANNLFAEREEVGGGENYHFRCNSDGTLGQLPNH